MNTNFTIPGLNAFVDISHHQANVDLVVAKKAGLVGLIHKATQDTTFVDNLYASRIQQAKQLGLLVGAYHFGTAAPVDKQVAFFLSTLKDAGQDQVVPCLDWENNPTAGQGTMTLQQAGEFVTLFYKETGIYPVIYGGYWMFLHLGIGEDSKLLGKCPLWQGFYSRAFGYLTDIWDNWTMLQYTDGTLGPEPHTFDGIGAVDRDTFNGTLADAQNFWQKNSLKK